jgi:hypothetical protein
MSKSQNQDFNDAALLTRTIEKVFRKLVRIVLGRISLVKLQEILKVAFVREAEAKIRDERSGRKVPLTSLAILTGLDTRVLAKILNDKNSVSSFHQEQQFLRDITPECSVLDVWESSPKYTEKGSNTPKKLIISGKENSFESLVKEALTLRGVTVQSILSRLIQSNCVRLLNGDTEVELLNKRYTPFESKDQMAVLEIGLIAVGNLLDTVTYNFNVSGENGTSFYQRGCWTHRLNAIDRPAFRAAMRDFLSKSDANVRNEIRKFERNTVNRDQVTAGVSFFYFEDGPA